MARGFWTGLLHGGVVSIIAVAALSLAAPLPQPEPAPTPQPAPAIVPVKPQPAPALTIVPVKPQPAPAPQPGNGPQAGAVDLPVGSEFGRGGDVVPRLPVPLATDRPDQAEAPAVMAPTSEPAPVALTAADPRPQPAGDGDGPVQGTPVEGENAPQLDRPAALPQPVALAVPDRTTADVPDAAPAVPADKPPAPAEPAAPRPEPQIPTPGLPAPVLDLSLPPDLSDLQGLTRD